MITGTRIYFVIHWHLIHFKILPGTDLHCFSASRLIHTLNFNQSDTIMAELLTSLNWLAVFAATLVYFFLGAVWYSPLMFAKSWMKLRNLKEEEMDGPDPFMFIYSFILQLIAVISLALFLLAMQVNTASAGAFIGFGAGAGFLLTLAGNTGIFSELKMPLHFIDNGYHVVGLTLAGLILGWW